MNNLKRDVKKLLTGFLHDDGKIIVPAEKIWNITYHGTFSGAMSARVFGIFRRTRQYQIKMKTGKVKEACTAAFLKMGRCAALTDDPEGLTVLCFPVLHNPCVLNSHVDGNTVTVDFFAARTVRAFLNARRAFRQWEKLMPEDAAERIDRQKTDKKKKQTEKQDKKEKKGRRTS